MTDADLLTRWEIGIAAAAVVVVLVAVLSLLIIVAARGILAAAVRCLGAVEGIRTNVAPLWDLRTTNDVAAQISGGAHSIENKTQLLAHALEAHEPTTTGAGAS
ncbi:MAG: hypothetical protein M3019_00450 [Candidatus Dormibacteraeota bacterium]|nr:hypothetical protein [Candidatus Dormibacteraeota bacterium]